MKHILVPTDFSETALSALHYAVALALQLQAQITILHSYDDPTEELIVAEKMAKLHDVITQKNIHSQAEIFLISLRGNFMDIVSKVVTETTFSYIVMGMRGKRASIDTSWLGLKELSTINNFWIGSHTTQVLENIKIPLLVVPQHITFCALQQITLAINTKTAYEPEIFIPLQNLVTTFQSNLTLVTIRLRDEPKDEELEELQLKKAKKWLGYSIPCSFKVVLADAVHEGLQYYSSQENTQNMLVMVTRKKDFFAKVFGISATQQVIHSANLPILVLHH